MTGGLWAALGGLVVIVMGFLGLKGKGKPSAPEKPPEAPLTEILEASLEESFEHRRNRSRADRIKLALSARQRRLRGQPPHNS